MVAMSDNGHPVKEDYLSSNGDGQTPVTSENESQIGEGSQRSDKSQADSVVESGAASSPRLTSRRSSVKPLGHSFDFHSRTNFEASKVVLQSRSDSYILRPPPPDYDVWKRKPPDFRPQSFAPSPPPRNSKSAVKPWLYTTPRDSFYEEALNMKKEEILLPDIANPKVTSSRDRPEFIRRFHIVDPDEARQAAVRERKNPGDVYVPPKPHDYRGYPPIQKLGLDEFVTSYERDPFNIKFHTARPRTLVGPPLGVTKRDVLPGPDFAPVLRQPPKWELRLHHPKDPFPNRPKDYTRYRRRNRDVHSAFMDRVEETLTMKWSREKMERALVDQSPREVKAEC